MNSFPRMLKFRKLGKQLTRFNMRRIKIGQAFSDADIEELHRHIVSSVTNHSYDSYIDALTDYVKQYGVNLETISELLSPVLKDKIYEEAIAQNLIVDPHISSIPDELF